MTTKNRLSAGERKQAIVAAAIRLFSEKGFRGVTTRELAQAVGVSEPVLYQHFQTKQDIYVAILDSMSAELTCKVEQAQALLSDRTRSDRDILRAMATEITKWHTEKPELSRLLLYSALEGHEFSSMFFARHATRHFEMVKTYLEEGIAAGRFRSTMNPSTAVWMFLGMKIHQQQTIALQHFNPYPQSIEQTIDEMVDLFLNGILAGGQK